MQRTCQCAFTCTVFQPVMPWINPPVVKKGGRAKNVPTCSHVMVLLLSSSSGSPPSVRPSSVPSQSGGDTRTTLRTVQWMDRRQKTHLRGIDFIPSFLSSFSSTCLTEEEKEEKEAQIFCLPPSFCPRAAFSSTAAATTATVA